MDEPRVDFIAELLRESEEADQKQRIEVDKLRADQLLTAIAIFETQMNDVNDLVDKDSQDQQVRRRCDCHMAS